MRFFRNYTIYTALLLGFVALCNGSEIKTFRGSINDKHVIKMTLNIKKSGEIIGFYYYETQRINIPLHGKMVNNHIELAENIEFSGRFMQGFKGVISNDEIKGIWADSLKKQKFKFSLALEARNVPDQKFYKMDGRYREISSDSSQVRNLKLHYVSANLFKFEISISGSGSCTGFISGLITFKNNKAVYKDSGCQRLELVMDDHHIKLAENNCDYHGMQCEFAGTYAKH